MKLTRQGKNHVAEFISRFKKQRDTFDPAEIAKYPVPTEEAILADIAETAVNGKFAQVWDITDDFGTSLVLDEGYDYSTEEEKEYKITVDFTGTRTVKVKAKSMGDAMRIAFEETESSVPCELTELTGYWNDFSDPVQKYELDNGEFDCR